VVTTDFFEPVRFIEDCHGIGRVIIGFTKDQ
jgi:hypothetical protein